MLRRHGWLGLLFLLPLLAHAVPAYGAATAASPGDPPAGSPSGAVYQLPLEKGRSDAAPKGSGGTGAPAGLPPGGGGGGSGGGGGGGGGEQTGSGGATEGSFYRSENNFGSSSKVPGVGADGGGESASGKGASTAGNAGTAAGGEGGSESPTGLATAASHVTDSGNTSSAANILLLVAIGLIAMGVAVVGSRANKLKSQRPSSSAS